MQQAHSFKLVAPCSQLLPMLITCWGWIVAKRLPVVLDITSYSLAEATTSSHSAQSSHELMFRGSQLVIHVITLTSTVHYDVNAAIMNDAKVTQACRPRNSAVYSSAPRFGRTIECMACMGQPPKVPSLATASMASSSAFKLLPLLSLRISTALR